MPVRAVNLKLVVPRQPGKLAAASALWSTHEAVNRATKFYEEMLLLCRQENYQSSTEEFGAESLAPELEKLIRNARSRNGYSGDRSLSQAKQKLRRLYEIVIPPIIGGKGTAQSVGGFVSPLLDPASRGFTEIFDKIKDPPNWVDGVRDRDIDAMDAAYAWLETPRGEERLRATGAPAKWMRLARDGNKDWPSAFVEDLDKKVEEAKGTPTLMQELRDLGVLPLFPSYFASRIEGYTGEVSTWDRLAMRLAVAHLLSWESWVTLARDEHAKRTARLAQFNADKIIGDTAKSIDALRDYENQRAVQLRDEALSEVEKVRVTPRTIRGWTDLREKWLSKVSASPKELIDIMASEQSRRIGKFGDPHFFQWLADKDHIWRTAKERDDVALFATLRSMEDLVERSRDTAFMTMPEAVEHPRSVQWEPEGGANLKNFALTQSDEGDLSVKLPLLLAKRENLYEELKLSFPLAKSHQLNEVSLERKGKKYWFGYKTQTDEKAEAVVGSADLMMNWHKLRQRSPERREAGDIGPAFLKLALDVQPLDPVGDPRKSPPAVHHFNTASGVKTRHADGVEEGFRILSVDLGVRTMATCSVFEIKGSQHSTGLSFPIADLPMRAVHERSFTLQLDGEEADSETEAWRLEKSDELRRLRSWLKRYRDVRALHDADPGFRMSGLAEAKLSADETGWSFEKEFIEQLEAKVNEAEVIWHRKLADVLQHYRSAMADVISIWRKQNRSRSADARSGKSMWAIEHLISTRRFLMSWSLLSERGEISRLDNETNGVFARNLQEHTNALKNDRLKTGADLIVQSARGYRRDNSGRWEKVYAPCHAILFEDLTRYRMRTDRPRSENRLLMKWAHRAVPQEVGMQAELHGIQVVETGAAFSSRFHAATHTPGIRMHAVRKRDLSNDFLLDIIERQNPGIRRDRIAAEQLVQLDGGEIFMCCAAKGTRQLHADVNAAQNLQRRFFTRHGDAFRLVARKVLIDGEEVWVPRSMGKRIVGALGNYGRLVPTGHQMGSCRFEIVSKRDWSKLIGEDSNDENLMGSEEDIELSRLEDEALERTGEVAVYFRDPSGIVLPNDLWYPSKTFWSVVKAKTLSQMPSSA